MPKTTKPTAPSNICAHCKKKLSDVYDHMNIAVGGWKTQVCGKCFFEWYEIRDKLVAEAFQEFTKVEST